MDKFTSITTLCSYINSFINTNKIYLHRYNGSGEATHWSNYLGQLRNFKFCHKLLVEKYVLRVDYSAKP